MQPTHRVAGAATLCCAALMASLASADDAPVSTRRNLPAPNADSIQVTPLVIALPHQPLPFKGSDGRYHLQYELDVESFTGDRARLDGLEVVNAQSGATLARLDAQTLGARLVVRDRQAVPGEFGPSQLGIVYLHIVVPSEADIPLSMLHRVTMSSGGHSVTAIVAQAQPAPPSSLVLDPPLRGSGFIAGDACCDSKRHVRATLSLNGRAFDAQRFAIDWEQLDGKDRIYTGDPRNPHSYVIYGKPAYAVADARVVAAEDDMADSPIGALPNLSVDKADGNHVVLDLGQGRYALYAHFQPHSVRVQVGQFVHRGDLLGLVGTSGNSSEPHLHFHVSDGPSMMSNGIPYVLKGFRATRRVTDTAAFDQAIIDGAPIPTEPLSGGAIHSNEYPLDLTIADLPPESR